MFLVHISGIKQARAHVARLAARKLPDIAQETLVHTAHGESAHFLSPVLPIHLHLRHDIHRFRLFIGAQHLVTPQDVGVNHVSHILAGQYEGRNRVRIERRFGQLDAHHGVRPARLQPDGNARLRVAQTFPLHGLDNLRVGGGHREQGRREQVAAQRVSQLKIIHKRTPHDDIGHTAHQQNQEGDDEHHVPHETAASQQVGRMKHNLETDERI